MLMDLFIIESKAYVLCRDWHARREFEDKHPLDA